MKLLEKPKFSSSSNISETEHNPTKQSDLYNITVLGLNGNRIPLSDFKGKYILFVNVASECGFTPQYRELQKLSDSFKDQLVVIGLPCNQFGNQEPGSANQIQTFCERNFDVSFLLTDNVTVKGAKQHPLYTWLTKSELNGVRSSSVKWNFQKYLVDDNGKLIDFFYSITKPMSPKSQNTSNSFKVLLND